jgi:hypothetical protein
VIGHAERDEPGRVHAPDQFARRTSAVRRSGMKMEVNHELESWRVGELVNGT